MTKSVGKGPPSSIPARNIQFDLFSQFVTNNKGLISNTVEYWERIPKYFLTPAQVVKLRGEDGMAQPYEYEYAVSFNDETTGARRMSSYTVEIQPALIKQPDGNFKAFFPGKSEEIIEEVLKKFFTDQQYGLHDVKKTESWVRFSYSMIRRELYRMGNGLRHDQIKQSLEIMSKCVLTVHENNKKIYTGGIIQDYCSVDRKQYLDDTDAQHIARMPVFISHAVNTLKYRQYNYARFMECKEQLSRFLYKRLVNRFTNANYVNDYSFMYTDIKLCSGLLQQDRENDNRKKVKQALEELQKKGVLSNYVTDERKKGRTIIEVKYTVTATPDFIKEQKAANKRKSNNELLLIKEQEEQAKLK